MHTFTLLSLLGAGTALAHESHIFVTSYAGTLSTLTLDHDTNNLTNTSVSLQCNPSPSWISVDKASKSLICVGEGMTTKNGTVSTFAIDGNGTLVQQASANTLGGPVFGSFYGKGNNRAVALAHYGVPGAVSTFKLGNDLKMTPLQNVTFPAFTPLGPVAASQAASHAHETIVDPTGKYLLIPDLGADLVRIFTFDPATAVLRPAGEPLKVKPGTGPRHILFNKQGSATYMYVVGELGATITSFAVTYGPASNGLTFKQIFTSATLGDAKPKGKNAPAELHMSPDKRFLVVSNRNDTTYSLKNPDPKNSTRIPSDSLTTFAIQPNGGLKFAQLWPAGGAFPRTFDFNLKGDRVAVGLQSSGWVVVLKRDVQTGMLGNVTASYGNSRTGMVSSVKWWEPAAKEEKKDTHEH